MDADGNSAQARFQLGLVESARNNQQQAADAFAKAAELDPQMAYAHYEAGMAFYKAKKVDRMAVYFENFLKLAPNAPERPAVQSIMKTVRGALPISALRGRVVATVDGCVFLRTRDPTRRGSATSDRTIADWLECPGRIESDRTACRIGAGAESNLKVREGDVTDLRIDVAHVDETHTLQPAVDRETAARR